MWRISIWRSILVLALPFKSYKRSVIAIQTMEGSDRGKVRNGDMVEYIYDQLQFSWSHKKKTISPRLSGKGLCATLWKFRIANAAAHLQMLHDKVSRSNWIRSNTVTSSVDPICVDGTYVLCFWRVLIIAPSGQVPGGGHLWKLQLLLSTRKRQGPPKSSSKCLPTISPTSSSMWSSRLRSSDFHWSVDTPFKDLHLKIRSWRTSSPIVPTILPQSTIAVKCCCTRHLPIGLSSIVYFGKFRRIERTFQGIW